MDARSFYLNFEITSVIHEPDLCRAMESSFEKDKKSSRLVTLEQWQTRPVAHKGMDSVCRLLSALL
jgi:cardiolipin synthase